MSSEGKKYEEIVGEGRGEKKRMGSVAIQKGSKRWVKEGEGM
jgi:hypothetical protein